MSTLVGSDDFGGGYVRLRFKRGSEELLPGRKLTKDEILAMANYRNLVRTEYISLYPEERPDGLRRFVRGSKDGSYSVIEGLVVGESLTKTQAEELARGN